MTLKITFQVRFSKDTDVFFSLFERTLMGTVPYLHIERMPFRRLKSLVGFFVFVLFCQKGDSIKMSRKQFFCVFTELPW